MFDVGFWELGLLAIIGLIVLGPERLPVVARTLGLWVGRARGYVRGLTSELESEMRLREMREHLEKTRSEIRSKVDISEREAQAELAETRERLEEVESEVRGTAGEEESGDGERR